MPLERLPASTSYIDVVERVLDKGIVVDVSLRVSVIGIEVLTIDAGMVVASIETWLLHADLIRYVAGGHEAVPDLENEPEP